MSEPLPLVQATDLRMVGGKALALGELKRAGFRVPDGFVITAQSPGFSKSIEASILACFDRLASRYVAVRSSAVAEDGANATWAGQLDTFLNVERRHLLSCIQKCQSSDRSARAKSYAEQQNMRSGGVAVIVQQMVQSDISGVAFSVHPVTKNKAQIVLEAAFGLGEAVVSGEVTPDTYIVDKVSGKVLETHTSVQLKQLVQGPRGDSVWQEVGQQQATQKLSDRQIEALSKLVGRLEKFYGFPVDVEWGLTGGQFYILQSRPVTTLS